MGVADVLQLAGQSGPMGLLVAYLIWRERNFDAKRLTYDQARLDADKALAASLGALTAVIQRLDR